MVKEVADRWSMALDGSGNNNNRKKDFPVHRKLHRGRFDWKRTELRRYPSITRETLTTLTRLCFIKEYQSVEKTCFSASSPEIQCLPTWWTIILFLAAEETQRDGAKLTGEQQNFAKELISLERFS
uniref:Uncharacterized protein n=1 Tax=Romanomermis culicivorax TaxID=13658 RepID=A0A915HZ65_ROMCU